VCACFLFSVSDYRHLAPSNAYALFWFCLLPFAFSFVRCLCFWCCNSWIAFTQSSRIQSPSPISVHFHVRADMFTSITRPCCSLVTWFSIPYQRISPRDLLDVKKSARYSCQRTGKHSNDPRTQLQMSRPSYLEWELEFEFGVGVEGKVYTLTPSQGRFSAICDLRFGVRSSVFVLCFMFYVWRLTSFDGQLRRGVGGMSTSRPCPCPGSCPRPSSQSWQQICLTWHVPSNFGGEPKRL